MLTRGDVHEVALALPEVREDGPLVFSLRSGSTCKGIALAVARAHPPAVVSSACVTRRAATTRRSRCKRNALMPVIAKGS